VKLALTGRLSIAAATGSAAPGEQVLALTISEPKLDLSGALSGESGLSLPREISRGFAVRWSGGRVTEVRTARDASLLTRNIAATLGAALALPAGSGAATWTNRERDAAGEYVAEYAAGLHPGEVKKRKLEYLEAATPRRSAALASISLRPRVIQSSGTLRTADDVWLGVEYSEQLISEFGPGSSGTARTTLQLKFRETTRSAAPPQAAALLASTSPFTEPRPQEADTVALDAVKIGDYTFASALAEFERGVTASAPLVVPDSVKKTASDAENAAREQKLEQSNRAFMALAALLRRDADQVRTIESRALRARAPRPWLDLLVATGSEEAQVALRRLANRPALTPAVRRECQLSLAEVERPTAETVEVLLKARAESAGAPWVAYGLGTQARRLGEGGQHELAERIVNDLVSALASAPTGLAKVHLLRGLANSGHPKVLAAVTPYLTDADDTLRGAAVEALRLVQDPAADELIARRLSEETSHVALRAGLNAVRRRGSPQVIVKAVESVARNAADQHVRYEAVQLLAGWLPTHGELRKTLAQVAQGDAVERIRHTAQAAL
jgi:hypothetical protein